MVLDQHPHQDELRILFVGDPVSSHTHAWIDLLAGSDIQVRLFALPTGVPPDDWDVYTYVTTPASCRTTANRFNCGEDHSLQFWLASVIADWQPQIVHTLGIEPAGRFLSDVLASYELRPYVTWVLQLRGGSDLALTQHDESLFPDVVRILQGADQIITDNQANIELARRVGVFKDSVFSSGVVPGTGGIDIAKLRARWDDKPSKRRIIVWSKAYNSRWSTAMPVLEAFRLVWRDIQPCEVHMLATSSEVRAWHLTLPAEFRANCRIADRVPRDRAIELMTHARVMLAPSLVDGTPNTLLEAMACGAVPIVSPLDTITPITSHLENVVFARNLYPTEIADALIRTMNDDELVDRIAQTNIVRVYELADRAAIRIKMIRYYHDLHVGIGTRYFLGHVNIGQDLGPPFNDPIEQSWPAKYARLQTEYAKAVDDLIQSQRNYGLLQSEYATANATLIETQRNLAELRAVYLEQNARFVAMQERDV